MEGGREGGNERSDGGRRKKEGGREEEGMEREM